MYNNSIPFVTAFELINEKNKNPDLLIFDTRERNEYKTSHIKGAMYVGFNNFDISRFDVIPRHTKIVVYCTLGVRSEMIAEKLKIAGFTDVRNLYGGLFEWLYQDQKLVDKKGNETDKVFVPNSDWAKMLIKGEAVTDH